MICRAGKFYERKRALFIAESQDRRGACGVEEEGGHARDSSFIRQSWFPVVFQRDQDWRTSVVKMANMEVMARVDKFSLAVSRYSQLTWV